MKIFDFKDYRAYIRHSLEKLPSGGHGEYTRMATAMRIQSSVLSQVMSGKRNLTAEMAGSLCEYYGFNELESDYFLALVQHASAGNPALARILERQLAALGARGKQIVNRMPKKTVLSEADQAIFYSQWYYSAVRLLTDVPGCQTPEAISRRLGLPPGVVNSVVQFLLSRGLCVEEKGKLRIGPHILHLPADSPLVARLHANWRLKAMERVDKAGSDELIYTSATVVSAEDAAKIRLIILHFIEEWGAAADQATSKELYCLNLDWVRIA